MPRCFVIQPFNECFDKRYEDTFEPAIKQAGLEAYRVDKDLTAHTPIDRIEEEIRNSAVCLADITLDNPNVWYELGYAFAVKRPVVMICSSSERPEKYPFDIQHRFVVSYSTQSSSDFSALQNEITARLKAALKISSPAPNEIANVAGTLSLAELAVVAAVLENVDGPHDGAAIFAAKDDVKKKGFNSGAFALATKKLINKGLLVEDVCEDDGLYKVLILTDLGWEWIAGNEGLFDLGPTLIKAKYRDGDDIPF